MVKQNKYKERLGQEKYNNQNCLMKIIEYKNARDITVEFQDEYKAKVCTEYCNFKTGNIKNPFYKSAYGVGMVGEKYSVSINRKLNKEYVIWLSILQRCFDVKTKEKHPTYKDVTCCKEWLLFENFYEWLHEQSNFDKWIDGSKWAVDKDILVKGNKVYSPDVCCLVSMSVNNLFTKRDITRGDLPIGVVSHGNGFRAQWNNPLINKREFSNTYSTIEQAFKIYKIKKEEIIKLVAQTEFKKGNITEKCYNAMLNYKVEITD